MTSRLHAPHPVTPGRTACGVDTGRRRALIYSRLDSLDCRRCRQRLVALAREHVRCAHPRYAGRRNAGGSGRHAVWSNGRLLAAEPSLALRNMSPNGFGWGYLGSGPAQLALAILEDYTRDQALALRLFIEFKEEVIRGIEQNEWELTAAQLDHWLSGKRHVR